MESLGTDEAWALEKFKEQSDIKVVHDYISSFSEAFAKLRTNPGAYDVIDFNVAFTKQAAQENLIQPIDVTKLKNFARLEENFRNSQEGLPGTSDDSVRQPWRERFIEQKHVGIDRQGEAYVIFGSASPSDIDLTTLSDNQGFIIQGDAGGDRAGYFRRGQTILLERERIKRQTIQNRRLLHRGQAA